MDRFFGVLLVVLFVSRGFCGVYGGGAGTAEEPFLIGAAEHLVEMSENDGDWDKHFRMTTDIDLSGYVFDRALIGHPMFEDFWPDDTGIPFTGVFDGNEHIIRNLTINISSRESVYIGLFGGCGASGKIMNLGVDEVSISANPYSRGVGGLVGINEGLITNCYVVGSVQGAWTVGGLVGNNKGSITNCYALGSIDGILTVGGFAGSNSGLIKHCYSVSSVSSDMNEYAGGFVGGTWGDTVVYEGCFWNIEIASVSNGVGHSEYPEGVIGSITGLMQQGDTFVNEGWDFVGESANGDEDVWREVRCGYPVLSWQKTVMVPDVSGISQSSAEELLMSAGATVVIRTVHSKDIPSGEVIWHEPGERCEAAIVTLFVSDGFPYDGGMGTKEEPYRIRTAEQMNAIGANPGDRDKHFALMNDIDLSEYAGIEFNIIGGFSGVFDGKGHNLFNFTYQTSSWTVIVGLFGVVDSGGEVKNLGLIDARVGGPGWGGVYGSLAGFNLGAITNCFAICSVSNGERTGGLVGDNYQGIISGCYTIGDVSGDFSSLGGLAGENSGVITNCYSLCSVSNVGVDVGGLVGANTGMVSYCYSGSRIISYGGVLVGYNDGGSIESCFWDSEINPEKYGGYPGALFDLMGRTTAEMQIRNTFVVAGWDFVGEDVNGSDDVWRMCLDGVGYPRLAWEFDRGGDFDCPDGVGVEDLGVLMDQWLNNGGRCDLDGDGIVGLRDYAIFAEFWVE